MTGPADGLSAVIPTGGRQRLDLLAATLASARESVGVAQIVVSELGDEPFALDIARRWNADYVFTQSSGPFERARVLNTGSRMASQPDILWCDGDLLFARDFPERAQQEFRAGGADYFYPFSRIDYLDQVQSGEVVRGVRGPADCHPVRVRLPWGGGQPGAMGLVRADFLRRHGALIEGFLGWGAEDEAWVHKVSLLGRIGMTACPDRPVWHLFHPDSGSYDADSTRSAAARNNPFYVRNVELLDQIRAIDTGETLSRQFPPPAWATMPWPESSRIVCVALAETPDAPDALRARDTAECLEREFGIGVPVVLVEVSGLSVATEGLAADAVVGFATGTAACAALTAALRHRLFVLIPGAADAGDDWLDREIVGSRVLASTPEQAAIWRRRGMAVWHRTLDAADSDMPMVAQPLSELLGTPRIWTVRIVLDRDALPAAALERPSFWYVGFHDGNDVEVFRQDANRPELHGLLARAGGEIVIERQIRAARPPATWIVWPNDRRREWVGRMSGVVDAGCIV